MAVLILFTPKSQIGVHQLFQQRGHQHQLLVPLLLLWLLTAAAAAGLPAPTRPPLLMSLRPRLLPLIAMIHIPRIVHLVVSI